MIILQVNFFLSTLLKQLLILLSINFLENIEVTTVKDLNNNNVSD